jgi:polyribonucleotide nucleotidyltransferase
MDGLNFPRFSGHLQRLDRDSRQEVGHGTKATSI